MFKEHTFMPGETITAIFKKYCGYDLSAEEIKKLMQIFNDKNGARVPHPGEKFYIPLRDCLSGD